LNTCLQDADLDSREYGVTEDSTVTTSLVPTVSATSSLNPEPEGLQGFLLKEGTRGIKRGWKRRWFSTEENRLNYYLSRGDKDPIGVITILPTYTIEADQAAKTFSIKGPSQVYKFQTLAAEDVSTWVNGLKELAKFYENNSSKLKILKDGVLMKR
jgi:hypothetical protein